MTDLRRENGWRDDLWDGGIKRGRELQAKEDKAEIDALRAQLTDTQAALAEAVGALEESIGIVKGGDCRARNCPECELKYCNLRDLLKRVNCIIQSTAAKAAGERWRAMERVVEAARAYTCNPGNRLDHYHRLCAAVAAYEMEVAK